MKRILYISIIAILVVACKKEIKPVQEITENESVTASNIINPCYGDNWATDQDHVGISGMPFFVYNNKAWFINRFAVGTDDPLQNTISIYDGSSWLIIPSDIPGPLVPNLGCARFVLGNKGYICSPDHSVMFAYDFANNTWQQKASFPGPERTSTAFFSINNKGYIVGGRKDAIHYNETWEYSPFTNSWTQKKSFPSFGKETATGFSIGNKGYIVNGRIKVVNASPPYYFYLNDLMEYDPSDNTWQVKAAFPGYPRAWTTVFTIGSYAYAGGGGNSNADWMDFYRYNPATNTWIEIDNITGGLLTVRTGFAINSKGYAVLRNNGVSIKMQKYTPKYCPPVSPGRAAND